MSLATTRLRTAALDKVFGGGVGGFVAATALSWGIEQLKKRNDPVTLEVSSLRPGEQYVVTTRPAMQRPERKLTKKRDAASRKLDALTAPSRSTIRTAKKLAKAQRQTARRSEGTPRFERSERRVERYGTKFDAKTVPSRKVAALQRKVDAYDVVLAEQRAAALARTAKSRRRPRKRTYR